MAETLSAGRSRGEYAKTAAKRTAILDAALEVFSQSGYRSGSLRDVAARVGMSEAGVLHHFPSKGALLHAVLDHRDNLSAQVVDFTLADGVESLRRVVGLARHNASVPGVVELYTILSAEATSPAHPAHEYFKARYVFVRDSVKGVFDRIAASGRLRPGVDSYRAAVATVAMMDGLQVQWLLDPSSTDMAASLAEFFRGFVKGFDPVTLERPLDAAEPSA